MKLKNILGFAFGPITTMLIGSVTAPITAWLFSPADVGRLNVFQITLSFALLLSVLGLDQAYVREYHEAEDKEQLLIACFLPGLVLLLVLSVASSFFASELSSLLYADSDPWLYLITVLAFFVSYISRFLSLILRMQERGWAYSISQVLPKFIQLGLLIGIALAVVKTKFVHLHLITLTSMLSVLVFYTWNTRRQWLGALGKPIKRQQLKQLLSFGYPLIFSGVAYWGLTATSTIALRRWSTLDELAVYSVSNSFAAAAIIFQSVFSVVWAPTVYKWVSQGADLRIVDQVAQQALAVVCVLVALCGSLSWLCDWLLPERYLQVKYILMCMLIPPLLYTLSEVTCIGIGIQRKNIFSIWITLTSLLANICLNYVLVPRYGAAGAAVANSIAFVVFFLGRTEISALIWRSFPRARLYLYVCGLVALIVLMVFFASSLPVLVHVFWVALLPLFFYIFRSEWCAMVVLIKKRVHLTR